jgi:hypothetical protein
MGEVHYGNRAFAVRFRRTTKVKKRMAKAARQRFARQRAFVVHLAPARTVKKLCHASLAEQGKEKQLTAPPGKAARQS